MKVSDTQKRTIQLIIEKVVNEGAKVMTDEMQAYKGLDKRFTHGIVRHGEGIYVIEEARTNTVEGFWSQLKRSIYGTQSSSSAKHLDTYINENEICYNSKDMLNYGRFKMLYLVAIKD